MFAWGLTPTERVFKVPKRPSLSLSTKTGPQICKSSGLLLAQSPSLLTVAPRCLLLGTAPEPLRSTSDSFGLLLPAPTLQTFITPASDSRLYLATGAGAPGSCH